MESLAQLAAKDCVPCKGGTPPLAGAALETFAARLGSGWKVIEGRRLEKEYRFKDFAQALAFTNQVGAVEEAQDHHPDILLSWGKVRVTLWTHTIGGLSENDFVVAAKIETLRAA
jgi:4a-hydroxytetrahydrobiopterin dehydratase